MKTALIILAVCFGFITFMVATASFGKRCTNAGYEGPQHEMCVRRLSKGGPLYEENIERWD